MGSLRDIRRRIVSVTNTRQITRAMKLVAGAKLRRATEAAVNARPYQEAVQNTLARVVSAAGEVEHPLLTVPDNDTDVLVVVLGSDRGLCGSFNTTLCRRTQERIADLNRGGKSVRLWTFGKKTTGYFKNRGYDIERTRIDLKPSDYVSAADTLAAELTEGLVGNEFGQANLAYNAFKSIMTQTPSFVPVLPMQVPEGDESGPSDFLYEPGADEFLGALLPMALRTQILQAFLETEAGEQAARMTAMDSATRNASELIDALTLQFNRARQASITKELIEIISGAEAL